MKKIPKNHVGLLLLSTDGKASSERRTKQSGTYLKITNKPTVIRQYNDNMGGVDVSDQMLYQYLDERRTLKLWKKITFNIFGRVILNSYILYKLNSTRPLSRLDYIISIIEHIEKEWLKTKNSRPNDNSPGARDNAENGGGDACVNTFFEKLPNNREKNCCVCSSESIKAGGKRKKYQHFNV